MDYSEDDLKKIKAFANGLRCPLCKCLMEGNVIPNFRAEIRLHCVWNPEHFLATVMVSGNDNAYLEHDQLIYTDIRHKKKYYIIRQLSLTGIVSTRLRIYVTDGNGDQLAPQQAKEIDLPGNVFDYSRLDEQKVAHLIKTVLIFN